MTRGSPAAAARKSKGKSERGSGRETIDHERREAALHAIARTQQGMITRAQLREVGVSDSLVRYRAHVRRFTRLHQGVYSLHPPPYTREQRWLAAVLACGPDAVLSDLTAATLWGVTEVTPREIHVTCGRRRIRPGLVVHKREVDPVDRKIRNGIPCTCMARVLIDVAAQLDEDGLEQLLVAAESMSLLNRKRLDELLEAHAGRPGTARLSRVAALAPILTRSELERIMVSILRQWKLPSPIGNHPIAVEGEVITVDFCWPEFGLVIETDGRRYHDGWEAAETDRSRDQLLAIAGWQVIRFTHSQLKSQRKRSGRRLKQVIDARREALQPTLPVI